MRKVFVVTFEDLSIQLVRICNALYLAEAKTDISTDGSYLSIVCYVKDYRIDDFLQSVKLAGGICTEAY